MERKHQTAAEAESVSTTTSLTAGIGNRALGGLGTGPAGAAARALVAGTPLSNRAFTELVARAPLTGMAACRGGRVLAWLEEAAGLTRIAAKARANAGGFGWSNAHRLIWELIHSYCPDKAGALAGSQYRPDGKALSLDARTIAIGDSAIARVARRGRLGRQGAACAARRAARDDASPGRRLANTNGAHRVRARIDSSAGGGRRRAHDTGAGAYALPRRDHQSD